MTINQAKGLKVGQRVTHWRLQSKGTVYGHWSNCCIIGWDGSIDLFYYPYPRMNSIHVMAN